MKLKPFEEFPPMVHKAQNGIAVRVVLDVEDMEPQHQKHYYAMLGFTGKEKWKFCTILSEIANMPGHYVVVGKNNQIAAGLHGDIFYIDLEDICD